MCALLPQYVPCIFHIFIYIYIIYVYIYMYVYIYICIHTHTYTYIHTDILCEVIEVYMFTNYIMLSGVLS